MLCCVDQVQDFGGGLDDLIITVLLPLLQCFFKIICRKFNFFLDIDLSLCIIKGKYQNVYKVVSIMRKYYRNSEMEFIGVEDTLAIFDPTTGDTVVLDKSAFEIISLLEQPASIDEIIKQLCKLFDGNADTIKEDVQEFIESMVEQKILLSIEA